ncbi:YbaB/EbfC family nucleoid-associated protein [Oceanithermus sp.]|uniref:YbaB/EbfC family nucleoid-associated protein n=1 Tax=Oceanithermus sp. TaxID=2268145 RepID=UPI0025D90ABD|nr:YbaB/EbfC family nucleoid-associated protein [Oceanithermus sp.]
MNFQKLLKEAKKAQQKAAEVQEKLAAMTVVGSAGGGLVEVTANGHGHVIAVALKPEAVDPDDVEALEDLLLVAIQDAQAKAAELAEREMGGSLGQVGDMLGGLF